MQYAGQSWAHWCTEVKKLERMKQEMKEKVRANEEGQQKDTICNVGRNPTREFGNKLEGEMKGDPRPRFSN